MAESFGIPNVHSQPEAAIVNFLASFDLVHPHLLRAVPAHRALVGCGRLFRSPATRDYSVEVSQIDVFWSHSWHGPRVQKFVLLLVLYNGLAAALIGTLVVAGVRLLFEFGPKKTYLVNSDAFAVRVDVVLATMGGFGAAAVSLFLWRSRQMIFFDRMCIDTQPKQWRVAQILQIGAMLKRSKSLLVCWDESFAQRLWCMFELAAFMKAHPQPRLIIRPTNLGLRALQLFVCLFFVILAVETCRWYNVFDLSTSLAILVLSAMLLPLMLIFAGLVNSFRAYFRGVEAMRRQLEEFRLADAMCHCCSRGHEEQPKKCDRDLLSACVGKWFGSVEEFEVSVRTQVASTLDQQLGAHAFPYCWLLAATSPISWRLGSLRSLAGHLGFGFGGQRFLGASFRFPNYVRWGLCCMLSQFWFVAQVFLAWARYTRTFPNASSQVPSAIPRLRRSQDRAEIATVD